MPIAVIISIISVTFSVLFGLFTLGFNLKSNRKSNNLELTERVKENTRINMKLDTISSNTTEIKNEVTEMRKELNSHDSRIVKVEESVKLAQHRIDGLETRLNEDKEVYQNGNYAGTNRKYDNYPCDCRGISFCSVCNYTSN